MRKLILQMQASIDGYVGGDAPFNWQLWGWGDDNRWDEQLKHDFNATLASVGTILLSRKMIEQGYLAHWSEAARKFPSDPFFAFARRIVEIDKIVLSDRLNESRWDRVSIRSGDLKRELADLKRQEGGDIITFGGAGFGAALLQADLVDRLQLYVNPAVLGKGLSIFARSRPRRMRLEVSKAYACGMVVNEYSLL